MYIFSCLNLCLLAPDPEYFHMSCVCVCVCVFACTLSSQLCLALCGLIEYSPLGSSLPWDLPGNNNGAGYNIRRGANEAGLGYGAHGQKGQNPIESLTCGQGLAQMVKNPPAMPETWVWSLGQEDPLEKVVSTHSSILAWRISWTEEPGRLQSMGWQKESNTTWLSN